jgi:hypothetical protein
MVQGSRSLNASNASATTTPDLNRVRNGLRDGACFDRAKLVFKCSLGGGLCTKVGIARSWRGKRDHLDQSRARRVLDWRT